MPRDKITAAAAESTPDEATDPEPDRDSGDGDGGGERQPFTVRAPEDLVETFDDFVEDHTLLSSRNEGVIYAMRELLERENRL